MASEMPNRRKTEALSRNSTKDLQTSFLQGLQFGLYNSVSCFKNHSGVKLMSKDYTSQADTSLRHYRLFTIARIYYILYIIFII